MREFHLLHGRNNVAGNCKVRAEVSNLPEQRVVQVVTHLSLFSRMYDPKDCCVSLCLKIKPVSTNGIHQVYDRPDMVGRVARGDEVDRVDRPPPR